MMQIPQRSALILLTGLILFLAGCGSEEITAEPVSVEAQPIETPQNLEPDPFREAVNTATEAAQLTQMAKTTDEWQRVADLWQKAAGFMQSVPDSSPNFQTAQGKVEEYQANSEYAKTNAMAAIAPQSLEQAAKPAVPISQLAAQLKSGMTYSEVVDLLGRMPDTVVNDQIRQELGEPAQGNDLISFEWKNDNPDCHPVAVAFNPSNMTATGWDQGRTCPGASIFNEPFGKSCSESSLCALKE